MNKQIHNIKFTDTCRFLRQKNTVFLVDYVSPTQTSWLAVDHTQTSPKSCTLYTQLAQLDTFINNLKLPTQLYIY